MFDKILIESDIEMVVKRVYGNLHIAAMEPVILDCQDMLTIIGNISMHCITRTKNSAAHELVGVARNLGSKTWVGNVPAQVGPSSL